MYAYALVAYNLLLRAAIKPACKQDAKAYKEGVYYTCKEDAYSTCLYYYLYYRV